jgi:hypothetical protein
MDEVLGIPIGQLTINGLALLAIALVVTGLLTGRLVPVKTHEREIAVERERTADFRELWNIANRRGDVMETVAEDLVVVGENVNKLLKALPPAKGEAS